MLFVFIDFNYVLIFGTHLPFSTIEYLNESDSFFNSIIYAIQSYSFFVLFLCPMVVLILLLFLNDKNGISKKTGLFPKLITLLSRLYFYFCFHLFCMPILQFQMMTREPIILVKR